MVTTHEIAKRALQVVLEELRELVSLLLRAENMVSDLIEKGSRKRDLLHAEELLAQ